VAVCEKTEHAMCTIYDIHSQKKKKVLPDQDIRCSDYESKVFLSACFHPKQENKFILTLTGEPDWCLLLWDWDKLKVMNKIGVGITGVPFSMNQKGGDIDPDYKFEVSYSHDAESMVVVGMDTYRFLNYEEKEFSEALIQINGKDREMSSKYCCHAWMGNSNLIVCTEIGEIILCGMDGAFELYIPESPTEDNFKLEAIIPFSRGFIVGGNENGNAKFYAFEECDDPKIGYRLINREPISLRMENNEKHEVTSMAISNSEDYIYFTTKSN
jgi:hypothetical protein